MDSKSAKILLEAQQEHGEPSHNALPAVSLPPVDPGPDAREDLTALRARARGLSAKSAEEAEHLQRVVSEIARDQGAEHPEALQEIRLSLARFWKDQRDFDKALSLLEEELRRREDPEILSMMVEVLQAKGDLVQAEAVARRTLSLSKDDPGRAFSWSRSWRRGAI